MIRIKVPQLYQFIQNILIHTGMPTDEAAIVADMLVQAEQRGVHSHGIVCLPRYVRLMNQGNMRKKTEYQVERDDNAIAVWNGMRSSGQVLGYYAMKEAIHKAKQYGVGVVGVKHANHFGAGAYYAQMAQAEGMIGISTAACDPTMAPWGGAEKQIGNNPIAIAVPSNEEIAPVLDMAQSVVANGKITNMKRQGIQEIPMGWALDKNGVETTRMEDFYSVMPVGAYKGFGMALMVDILSSILFGGATGYRAADDQEGPAIMMMAWNIRAFRDLDEFQRDIDNRIRELKSARKAKYSQGVLMPGETEEIKYRESAAYAEVVPETLEEANKIADEMGIEKLKGDDI